MNRKLATIRAIEEIRNIEGADLICSYRVDNWWVVDGIGKYKLNDWVIFLEIDSWVPHSLAPFLSKDKKTKEFNGVEGARLKTIKLRGQLSQGLLLPLKSVEYHIDHDSYINLQLDDDLTDTLHIQLYEPPVKLGKNGLPQVNLQARKGGFPEYIPKSDQERIQNIKPKRFQHWIDERLIWEVTEKLDGSSMTVYVHEEDEGVCSRNINLKRPEEGENQSQFWHVALREGLIEKIRKTNKSLAIQGELIGPGIQGNPYSLDRLEFYCYNVWDIEGRCWFPPAKRQEFCALLDIDHVPIIGNVFITEEDSIQLILDTIFTTSQITEGAMVEGEVWKSYQTQESFKAISNEYLLSRWGQ